LLKIANPGAPNIPSPWGKGKRVRLDSVVGLRHST
jgi:hypothetical protein